MSWTLALPHTRRLGRAIQLGVLPGDAEGALVPVRPGTARGVPWFVTIVSGSAFATPGEDGRSPIVADAVVKLIELKPVRFPFPTVPP